MKLSVVIPAHNEESCIEDTLRALKSTLDQERLDHELVVVNDHSTDGTRGKLASLLTEIPSLRAVDNPLSPGYGHCVRQGLEAATGEAIAIFMADGSDSPEDLVRFLRTMEKTGVECVFGSRFIPGSRVVDYPWPKLILNRLANTVIRILFYLPYNDVTNAFKMYRRHVLEGLNPLLSCHFNLTVELPLKAIVRGYSYTVVPNSWTNRKMGASKFRIQEMGSRYLFIVLYCFIEKWLSRGDYKRSALPSRTKGGNL